MHDEADQSITTDLAALTIRRLHVPWGDHALQPSRVRRAADGQAKALIPASALLRWKSPEMISGGMARIDN